LAGATFGLSLAYTGSTFAGVVAAGGASGMVGGASGSILRQGGSSLMNTGSIQVDWREVGWETGMGGLFGM